MYLDSVGLGFVDLFWIQLGKDGFLCGCLDRRHRHQRRWRDIMAMSRQRSRCRHRLLGQVPSVYNVSLFRSNRSIVSHSFLSLSIPFVPTFPYYQPMLPPPPTPNPMPPQQQQQSTVHHHERQRSDNGNSSEEDLNHSRDANGDNGGQQSKRRKMDGVSS